MPGATEEKSIYKQCAEAVDRIAKKPPRQHGGVFTEIDVITAAANSDWTKANFDKATHEANEICGHRYRHRKLCRYGPVEIGSGSNKVKDYARIAGKIVYADAIKGPDIWKTINGDFKKLMFEDDTISRQGRKAAADRNDAYPWAEQVLPLPIVAKGPSRPLARHGKDKSLVDEIRELRKRVETLENKAKKQAKALA